jgi:hypothetical protein
MAAATVSGRYVDMVSSPSWAMTSAIASALI